MTTYLPHPDARPGRSSPYRPQPIPTIRPLGADLADLPPGPGGPSFGEPVPLLVTVEPRPGEGVLVTLDGDLDLAARDHVGTVLGDLVARGTRAIDIDARALTFADATGLGTLITARRRAEAARAAFRTIATSPALDRVLALTDAHESIGAVRPR